MEWVYAETIESDYWRFPCGNVLIECYKAQRSTRYAKFYSREENQ